MDDKVFLQESKEFQLKLDIDSVLKGVSKTPGPADEALFHAATQAMREAVEKVAHGHEHEVTVEDNGWHRDAIRYDTADGQLKENDLTVGIEATDERTKLKCKQHNLVPELLFDRPTHAIGYPDIEASRVYKKHDTKLKREQDIHFDNVKTCASGSLFVKGRQTDIRDSAFFMRYYPRLDKVLPKVVPLRAVSHWDEVVFDHMRTRWKHADIDTWMLVNRWDAKTGELLESELSFKIAKEMDAEWDYRLLHAASDLYLALRATRRFRELPPIFTFADPVSSLDIVAAPQA